MTVEIKNKLKAKDTVGPEATAKAKGQWQWQRRGRGQGANPGGSIGEGGEYWRGSQGEGEG